MDSSLFFKPRTAPLSFGARRFTPLHTIEPDSHTTTTTSLGSKSSSEQARNLSPTPSSFWSKRTESFPQRENSPSNERARGDAASRLSGSSPLLGQGAYVASPLSLPNPIGSGSEASFDHFTAAKLHHKGFWDTDDDELKEARRHYLRSYTCGVFVTIATLFVVLSIYLGSVWKVPNTPLDGIVVDFDGGVVGLNMSLGVIDSLAAPNIEWRYAPSTAYPFGAADLVSLVKDEETWVIISINPDGSQNLNSALLNANPFYDGSFAITVYVNEARSESTFRNFIRPQTIATLDEVTAQFAQALARQVSNDTNILSILADSPQTLTQPISYTFENVLVPTEPLAAIAKAGGLVYVYIASLLVVVLGHHSRKKSNLNKHLRLASIVWLRLTSSSVAYLFLSLFYSVVNKLFRLNVSKVYGRSGFIVFWMLHWIGMLAVGLAMESLVLVFTPRYILFFSVLWATVNISVCVQPLDTMPGFYKYGVATPFYHLSNAVQAITLGSKNNVGLNAGVLIVWVVISCISMPLIQLYKQNWEIKRLEERLEKSGGRGDLVSDASGSSSRRGLVIEGRKERWREFSGSLPSPKW